MILFFGPVGAGKSTQAELLVDRLGYNWISTGKMFRETKDPEMIAYLKTGKLVSDEQTEKLVETTFTDLDLGNVILDGFPRNVDQAKWLFEQNYPIELGIVIELGVDEAIARMQQRGRDDDTEDAIKERLDVYHQQVDPCINYLAAEGIEMVRVSGQGTVEEIHEKIVTEIKDRNLA